MADITDVTANPVQCDPNPGDSVEIDVTWTNNKGAAWMAVDQLLMENGTPATTNQVLSRSRTKGGSWQWFPDFSAISGNTYTYNVHNWDNNNHSVASGSSNWAFAGICPFSASTAFIQKYPTIFELLVPRGAVINDYTHEEGSILEGQWKHVHQLQPPNNDTRIQAETVNLVQSISGKLEAVARETPPASTGSDYLVAYELDPKADWKGPVNLVADDGPINKVTGPTALIQSTYNNQGKFELLVPRGAVIDHYTHERGSILEGPWLHAHTLKGPEDNGQIIAVSLVQSSSGKLEAIARIRPAQGNDYLVAYELKPASGPANGSGTEAEVVSESESVTVSISEDAEVVSVSETVTVSISESVSDPESMPYSASDWQGPVKLVADNGPIDHVSGSTAIMQSSQGTFELLVPRGAVIDQYTHEKATILEGIWKHVQTLKSPDNNAQITANWLIQSRAGKLEAVARISPPAGGGDDYLVGYESDPGAEWQGPVKLVANDGPILAGEPRKDVVK